MGLQAELTRKSWSLRVRRARRSAEPPTELWSRSWLDLLALVQHGMPDSHGRGVVLQVVEGDGSVRVQPCQSSDGRTALRARQVS